MMHHSTEALELGVQKLTKQVIQMLTGRQGECGQGQIKRCGRRSARRSRCFSRLRERDCTSPHMGSSQRTRCIGTLFSECPGAHQLGIHVTSHLGPQTLCHLLFLLLLKIKIIQIQCTIRISTFLISLCP